MPSPDKSVLVIGYGASGIAAVEQFVNKEFKVSCFEARNCAGGVWNYESADTPSCEEAAVQQTSLTSPIYDGLKTNLPHPLIAYRSKPFPFPTPLYPTFESVTSYLHRVANNNAPLVHFNTLVTRVRRSRESSWTITYRHLPTNTSQEEQFDFVYVANGHYASPYVPRLDGIQSFPGQIMHSQLYRRSSDLPHGNIVVVGSNASGCDITRELAEYTVQKNLKRKIYQSVKQDAALFSETTGDAASFVEIITSIKSIDEGVILLHDNTSLKDIDTILFATGYLFHFPFALSIDDPWKDHPLTHDAEAYTFRGGKLHETRSADGGLAVHNLDTLNLFYFPEPTLAISALHLKIVPFPFAENQARFVATYWSGTTAYRISANDENNEAILKSALTLGIKQFEYENELLRLIGEGEASDREILADGSFSKVASYREGLRLGGSVLKRAYLGY